MLFVPYYLKRILYYGAKLYQQQLHEGQDYLELKRTISISFLNHILFPQLAEHHLCFRLLESSRHVLFSDDVEFHILELPKFTKCATELRSALDVWLYFLRYADTIDTEALPESLRQHALVMRAVEELQMLAKTDVERERYEARRKGQLDYNTGVKVARMEGREEGRQEGLAEEKVALINFCERFLKRPETPSEQLRALSLEDLVRLASDLQGQMLQQRG